MPPKCAAEKKVAWQFACCLALPKSYNQLFEPGADQMFPVLDPVDYGIVRTVFTSLVRAEWFARTDDNIAACAKMVISQYAEGISEAVLYGICERIARERFSRAA